jgi:outer membrane protein assembly factor BamB
MSKPRAILGFTFVLALVPLAARAADWPQWLGTERDSVWRESGILTKFPEGGPKVRWRAPIAAGYSGPAVAEGRVYVTDRVLPEGVKLPGESFVRRKDAIPGKERVLCFNDGDGKLIWSHEYDCPYTVSYPLGPRCTPVVHEGKVYTLGAEGHLFCFDAAKGGVIWSKDFKKDYKAETAIWGHAAHPLIDGKKLICMVGGDGSAVVAFDKDTGKELWKSLSCKNIGYCPPTILTIGGKRQLIAWHGEAVNGLDPDSGSLYWSHPFQTYQAMAISTPRLAGDYLFLTSTFGNSIALKFPAGAATPEQVWKGVPKREGGMSFDSCFGTPFVADGHIYGTSSDGELMCIKPATGERLWQTDKPNGKIARCADVFIIKQGDRYFLWTEKGDLIIARLSPKGYEEVSRARLLEPTSAAFGRNVLWCHPAFANKSFYVRNDKELMCVSLAE